MTKITRIFSAANNALLERILQPNNEDTAESVSPEPSSGNNNNSGFHIQIVDSGGPTVIGTEAAGSSAEQTSLTTLTGKKDCLPRNF